jgi:hypothetical protein
MKIVMPQERYRAPQREIAEHHHRQQRGGSPGPFQDPGIVSFQTFKHQRTFSVENQAEPCVSHGERVKKIVVSQ